MALSEAQKRATKTYFKKNDLVEIKLRVPRSKRESLQQSAINLGYTSFNQFMLDALEEKIHRATN